MAAHPRFDRRAPRRYRGSRLRPGWLRHPRVSSLPLLPSGPDGVRRPELRRSRPSTPFHRGQTREPRPQRGNSTRLRRIAGAGYRQSPHLSATIQHLTRAGARHRPPRQPSRGRYHGQQRRDRESRPRRRQHDVASVLAQERGTGQMPPSSTDDQRRRELPEERVAQLGQPRAAGAAPARRPAGSR